MSLFPLGLISQGGGAGGGAAFELISTTVLGSSSSSVAFNSIASTWQHLQLRIVVRTDRALELDAVKVRLNSDSGSNYAWHRLNGTGSSVGSTASTSATFMSMSFLAGNTAVSNAFGSGIIDILDYTSTAKYKTARALSGAMVATYPYLGINSGLWQSTSTVTSITLLPESGTNFLTGSRFSLYGVRGS